MVDWISVAIAVNDLFRLAMSAIGVRFNGHRLFVSHRDTVQMEYVARDIV